MAVDTTTGVDLIAAERRRQIDGEGWTPEHDDMHIKGELARAAASYARPRHRSWLDEVEGVKRLPADWPWEPEWYKPTPHDRVGELVKAGALIAAEIDRLNRAAAPRKDQT